MLKKILYWLPAIIYMAVIFAMSSLPAPEPAKQVPIFFEIKLVHIVEYGILCGLIIFALLNTMKVPLVQLLVFAILLTVLYGISDEIHQAFNPARTARWQDVVANLTGSSIVAISYAWTAKNFNGVKR